MLDFHPAEAAFVFKQERVRNMTASLVNAPTTGSPKLKNASAQTTAFADELRAIRDDIGLLATEIRHFQAFGVDGDFDEWAFSLTFLEARLTRMAQYFPAR